MNVRGTGLWVLCYLALTAAMYFDLGEQEQKGLIKEIPGNMLITGYFLLEFSIFASDRLVRFIFMLTPVLRHKDTPFFLYSQELDDTFCQISEETNGKVLWRAVVLKDFLIAKKLV
uniref:Uncharacterized protein n=1 Tax=Salmo trutta TaxID=8032 RepID=A0A674B5I4_SALTR